MENQTLPKGRRTKALQQAISMLVECGMTSMTSGEYDYDEEEGFTQEDIDAAYTLILRKMFPKGMPE